MFAIIESMRPKQWVKNVFVFAPLLFSLEFVNYSSWIISGLGAAAFILVSGAVYMINDIADIESDRKHPTKKNRPIASGRLSKKTAIAMVIVLLALATILASLLRTGCFGVLAAYFLINIVYTFALKHLAIIDVLVISSGFVLRVIMGGYAIGVVISPWIILATFMVTLFLGFGKRRYEVAHISGKLRESLFEYNKEFLDKLINVTCAATLMSYAIYAVETAHRTAKLELVYTVAFVAFGLFRYLQFLYFEEKGGEPENIMFTDKWFVGNIVLWLITTLWILA